MLSSTRGQRCHLDTAGLVPPLPRSFMGSCLLALFPRGRSHRGHCPRRIVGSLSVECSQLPDVWRPGRGSGTGCPDHRSQGPSGRPSPQAWMETREAVCEGPGAEVGRDLLGREASKGRRQGPHARPACNEMIEPCKAGACPHSGPHSAQPPTPARRPGLPLRLILPCSPLLSGGAVRPHQSDPAAWN